MNTALLDLLSPQQLTEVVDVGANPIDGDPPYKPMLSAGLCRVTGFEPQEQALLELENKRGPNEIYLPFAVGDGGTYTFNICKASGMSSLLDPDPRTLAVFEPLGPLSEVTSSVSVKTRKLDDIVEIEHLDFLKIDVQGGELKVFQGGVTKLSQAVVIQTEISFVTLYKEQPCLGDIDLEMRRQGYIPHCFAAVKTWPIAPCVINNNPYQGLNQLMEADIVYVRDFTRPESISDEQLKQMALIAHHCYKSFDLALRCVMLLEQRNSLKSGAQQEYFQILNNTAK